MVVELLYAGWHQYQWQIQGPGFQLNVLVLTESPESDCSESCKND